MRWITLLAVSVVLATACGPPGEVAGGPTQGSESPAPAEPVDLIGLWEVLDAGEEPGAVLRLDVRSLRLFRECGAIHGDWNANHDGLFVAGSAGWSGQCAPQGDDPRPAWLLAAATFGAQADGHVLLDEAGQVVARLVPGEEPTVPSTMAQSLATPPVVTDEARRALAPAAPLPASVEPAEHQQLLGRWVPSDAPPGSESHARFHSDGTWSGSDGCNGLGGRWRAGAQAALLATGMASTDIGCENIPVEARLTAAARAGFDGTTLVLFDRQGEELGRFEPST